jgi:hypothetical protein
MSRISIVGIVSAGEYVKTSGSAALCEGNMRGERMLSIWTSPITPFGHLVAGISVFMV